jgi:hypothetical protein
MEAFYIIIINFHKRSTDAEDHLTLLYKVFSILNLCNKLLNINLNNIYSKLAHKRV